MQKLYSLIAALLVSVVSTFAGTVTINVNVGDVCTLSYWDSTTYDQVSMTLTEGQNVIEADTYSLNLALDYSSDYIFTECLKDGVAQSISSPRNLYLYSFDGSTYDLTVKKLDEAYDAKCTIKVDEPSNVSIRTNSLSREIKLESTENEVQFISALESPFYIGHSQYNQTLYKIVLNGVEQTVGSYNYIQVKDGDVIEITSEFPDEKYPLTFKYSEGAEGFITDVQINGTSVENFNDGVDVQVGSTVTIIGDTQNYKYESMTIAGSPVSYFYGSTSFTFSKETEVVVNAHKYGKLSYTINVDDPSNFTFFEGYSYNNNVVELKEGVNEMQISENSTAITFQANSGCYFSSITANGEEQYYSGSTQVVLYVTEGMVINVTSGKINRDQNLVVYVNDKLDIASMQYFSLTYSDRSSMGVTNGYNTVNFYSGDLPIYFSSYGSESDLVYLNDEVVDPMYSGSSSRQINEVPNNSVLKIFFNETPETYTVTVDADENLTVSATKDLISEVADCSSFTVLGTSNVSIAVSGADNEDKLVVKVNDQEVTAEDGKYSFTVSADTKVSVSKEAGVSNISVDNNASSEVYNLQGIRVARNANNINNLPAGIYIMNGKKVVIK